MSGWDKFVDEVVKGAAELAKSMAKGHIAQAKEDAEVFIERSKTDINRWTKLLAKHEISKTEFSDLMHGLKSLAAITALKQAGLTIIQVQRFRDKLIDLVVDKAFDILV
jgi:hypothetical protein